MSGTIYENLKIIDCIDFNQKRFLSYGQLIDKFQERLSYNDYFHIYSILSKNVKRSEILDKRSKTFSLQFLFSKNPNTKYISSIVDKNTIDIRSFTSIEFFNIYVNSEFNELRSKNFLNVWTQSFVPIDIRNFALLRNNNKIILNYQTSRFLNTGSNCNLCMLYPSNVDITETPEHLFYSCRFTKSLIDNYFHDFVDDHTPDWKEIIFKGSSSDDVKLRCFINTEIIDCRRPQNVYEWISF